MVLPWAEAGYRCICVDIQHPVKVNTVHIGQHPNIILHRADVLTLTDHIAGNIESHYYAVFAFPPCTHFAVSGARWFQAKGMDLLIEALQIVNACRKICEASGARYMIENPVGTLATYWRKPDHYFNPCDFGGYLPDGGDRYTKKTCLWTGGGFVMPDKRPVEPTEGSKMHLMAPGPERANLRSETPMGFARAVFQANT